jgi:hypothetical protein
VLTLVIENINEEGETYGTFPGTLGGLLGALNNLTEFPNDSISITLTHEPPVEG